MSRAERSKVAEVPNQSSTFWNPPSDSSTVTVPAYADSTRDTTRQATQAKSGSICSPGERLTTNSHFNRGEGSPVSRRRYGDQPAEIDGVVVAPPAAGHHAERPRVVVLGNGCHLESEVDRRDCGWSVGRRGRDKNTGGRMHGEEGEGGGGFAENHKVACRSLEPRTLCRAGRK